MPTPVIHDDKSVVNQALTALGENLITDFVNDPSPRAVVMRQHYEPTSEFCQVKSAWNFNTTKAALNKLSTAPINRWSAAWQLPADKLKVLTTWPISNYEIQNNRIFTNNTDQVHIDYQRKLEEAYWPAWFTRYVVAELVIRTCRGITGDQPDQDMKDELEMAMNEALFQDAQEQPNVAMLSNDFVDCRN